MLTFEKSVKVVDDEWGEIGTLQVIEGEWCFNPHNEHTCDAEICLTLTDLEQIAQQIKNLNGE